MRLHETWKYCLRSGLGWTALQVPIINAYNGNKKSITEKPFLPVTYPLKIRARNKRKACPCLHLIHTPWSDHCTAHTCFSSNLHLTSARSVWCDKQLKRTALLGLVMAVSGSGIRFRQQQRHPHTFHTEAPTHCALQASQAHIAWP